MRLDVREREHEVVAKLIDALRKFAGKLFVGGGEREFGARVDQIRDGLGLREVNATVEKRAARELARFGQTRAVGEQRVEHEFCRQQSAVAGNFDRVFARECARRAQDGEQHFINDFFVANDFAELNCVRRRGARFQ